MCCPNVGGAVRTLPGVSDSLIGAEYFQCPCSGVLHGFDHVPRRELRIRQRVGHITDCTARHAAFVSTAVQ